MMHAKITLIAVLICFALMGAWYLDFIPESFAPLVFIIVIVIGLHVLFDVLITIGAALHKLFTKK